jgi:hypothetical protein
MSAPPRIAPAGALYKHIMICNDFDVLILKYTQFVKMLTRNNYIDHYAEHSRYIGRLNGLLNEMYANSIDHYYSERIVAHHTLCLRKKDRLERIFHSGIKRVRLRTVREAVLKTMRAFTEDEPLRKH